jgi:hypothetical protein
VTTNPNPNGFNDAIDQALADPEPLSLLMMASTVIAGMEDLDEHDSPVPGEKRVGTSALVEFCDTLLSDGSTQTAALARVIGEIAGDDVMRERIRRELVERRARVPGWVQRLGDTHVYGAIEMVDVLGDGQNVVVAVQLPGRHSINLVVYIDHNVGTLVKDAYVVPCTLAQMRDAWNAAHLAHPEMAIGSSPIMEPPLADARARIDAAILRGRQTIPPFETETWPACRAIVEWALRMMPAGGTSFEIQEFSDTDLGAIAEDFFASRFGREFDDNGENWDVLDLLLEFGRASASGDPLRWSGVAVEIVLVDWIPRTVIASKSMLRRVPELLRPLIEYSHSVRKIPRELTADTLTAVDKWKGPYFDIVAALREPQTSGADDDQLSTFGITETEYRIIALDMLETSVGGKGVLQNLSVEPLPDEPFNWAPVPGDIADKVGGVLRLVDSGADALFDDEFRTASRRFLSRVAAADPGLFRGRAGVASHAAGILRAIQRANDDLYLDVAINHSGHRVVPAREIYAHLGATSDSSTRAAMMRSALGIFDPNYVSGLLSVDYLTSMTRRAIVDARDDHVARLVQLAE